jgi:hypothetical protein
MDRSQVGRAGELAVQLYALVTAAGELDLYSPVVDDDHVDLVAGVRGGEPALGLQVKTTDSLDRDGLVEARASYPAGHVRDDASFLYVVVFLQTVRMDTLWVIGSPDFNRLAYRSVLGNREVLEFRASPARDDAFSEFRVDPMQLGSTLLTRIEESPAPPKWLVALRA